ncbi:MAG: isoprenyl transferase [Candidatus Omnitrophica bacterium]|nr:isoprenyl transferase [Candidatus Omnitrophota bacterium]
MRGNLPRHIAIIMDGNGRWAKKRNLPSIKGHHSGVKVVSEIIEACALRGIEALTLYSFSTENWKRSKKEVNALMSLFEENLKAKGEKLKKNNVRFNVIGRIEGLPEMLQKLIKDLKKETVNNDGVKLTLAINYGGRQEIVDAAKKLYKEIEDKTLDITSVDEDIFSKALYTQGLPDPDLIIRTSGEMRISNFLLWQSAYSEFYITDTFWPDFNEEELDKAIKKYGERQRRFGE